MKPARGYEALRDYRVSIPGACYFVTLCTRDRAAGLNGRVISAAIATELIAIEKDGAFVPRAWVIMPDHLHLFFETTGKLSLGQIIGRLKAKTRGALLSANVVWQGNYYEHRLRPDDAVEDVLRYLYLNPYRDELVTASQTYTHFWLCEADSAWFVPMLNDNRPFPSWLANPSASAPSATLVHNPRAQAR
jgi:putative transposase